MTQLDLDTTTLAAAGADGIALALVTRGVHRARGAAEVRRVFRVSGRWGP